MSTQNTQAVATVPKPSALSVMATRFQTDPSKLLETLRSTVFAGANNEELMSLVVVSNEHGLNPFTREIYAFPKKGGGIQAVVSVDGWAKIMNSNPDFDGIQFNFAGDGDDLECTAIIFRKSRTNPTTVTEYYSECVRNTDPWKTCPRRMLRHKALIQAVRIAFGFAAVDPDDAAEIQMRNITPPEADTVTLMVPKPAETTQPEPAPALEPWVELENAVITNGYTFDDFRAWAGKSGQIPDADSVASFSDVSPTVAKRILRIKSRMLMEMEASRGGAQ